VANNLPTVSSPLPRDLQQFVQRVREALDGGGVDGVLTARKLIATGIVTGTSTGDITPSPSVNSIIRTIESARPPTNLSVSAAHASIIVSWNAPAYIGHAYTEIWAHTSDVIGDAVLVGMTSGNNFSHAVGGSGTRYYWVRNINQNGEASAFNKTAGTQGATSTSPNFLMELLAETYGTNSQSPFFQIGSATTINGVSVPAGTYMKSAFIHDASITNAKVKDLTADKITSSLLSTVDFYGNKIAGTDIHLGGTVNYNTDSDGNNIGIASVSDPSISLFGDGSGALFDVNVFSIRTSTSGATFTITVNNWEYIPVGAQIRFFKNNGEEITLEADPKNSNSNQFNVTPTSAFIGNTSTILLDESITASESNARQLRGGSYSSIWDIYTNRHQIEFEVAGKTYVVTCFGVITANAPFGGGSGATTNKLPSHDPLNTPYDQAGYPTNRTKSYGQTTGTTAWGSVNATGSGSNSKKVYTPSEYMTGATISVTVVYTSSGGYSGNAFSLDRGEQGVPHRDSFPPLRFIVGKTYTFNQNNATNDGHPLVFKKITSGNESNYEDGVKYFLNGSEVTRAQYVNTTTFNAGRSSGDRKIELTVATDAPQGFLKQWDFDDPNQYSWAGAASSDDGFPDNTDLNNTLRYSCAIHGNNMGNVIATYRVYPYYAWRNTQDTEYNNLVYTARNLAAAINGIPGLSATHEEQGYNGSNGAAHYNIIRVKRDTASSSGKTVVNREVTVNGQSLITTTNFNDATHFFRPEHNFNISGSGNSVTAQNIEDAIDAMSGFTSTNSSAITGGSNINLVTRVDLGNNNLGVSTTRVTSGPNNSQAATITVTQGVAGQTLGSTQPFTVSNNFVFIKSAMIQDASIDNAKIGNVIQSSNYSAGTAGWKIDKTGQIEANDATFRGTLDVSNAATGDRLKITSTKIEVFDGNTLRVRIGELS